MRGLIVCDWWRVRLKPFHVELHVVRAEVVAGEAEDCLADGQAEEQRLRHGSVSPEVSGLAFTASLRGKWLSYHALKN